MRDGPLRARGLRNKTVAPFPQHVSSWEIRGCSFEINVFVYLGRAFVRYAVI